MIISKNLESLLAAKDAEAFCTDLMSSFVADAAKRNPDVTNEKMLTQLARPKYAEAIKSLNAEIESLKIINRRNNG